MSPCYLPRRSCKRAHKTQAHEKPIKPQSTTPPTIIPQAFLSLTLSLSARHHKFSSRMCCSHLSLYGVDTLNGRYLIHYYMLFNSNHETIFFLIFFHLSTHQTRLTPALESTPQPHGALSLRRLTQARTAPEKRSLRGALRQAFVTFAHKSLSEKSDVFRPFFSVFPLIAQSRW
jgi:hypothetical protein